MLVEEASRHYPKKSKKSFSRKGKSGLFQEVVISPTVQQILMCHFPENSLCQSFARNEAFKNMCGTKQGYMRVTIYGHNWAHFFLRIRQSYGKTSIFLIFTKFLHIPRFFLGKKGNRSINCPAGLWIWKWSFRTRVTVPFTLAICHAR